MKNLFLVRYPEAPVCASPKRKLEIGRSGNNTIVLTESRVSRSHAYIMWEKSLDAYALTDLGSPNGTYLNNEKIAARTPCLLSDWDKIRIASAVFTVRIVEDPSLIKNEFKELRSISETQATVIARREDLLLDKIQPALSGDLGHLCPLELFQMLEVAEKSGVLALHTGDNQAEFLISRGRIISASFDERRGEEAVYRALKCNAGTFAFAPKEITLEQPEITVATTVLLMEGCRRLDESVTSGG